MKNKDEIVDNLIEELVYHNHSDSSKFLTRLENTFSCEIDLRVEKHNELQYTYYYEVWFDDENILNIEIENGINNGTRVNSVDWDSSTLPQSRTIEVLKDVIFNEKGFEGWCRERSIAQDEKPQLKNIALRLFENNKSKLLQENKNQAYDNYVTGGGTIKTNQHYRDFYSNLKEKGVFWEFVYEEKEVDINFI